MCGIFGYVGDEADTGEMVLTALKRLEYRGYDSWGVGVGINGHIAVEKQVGKIGGSVLDLAAVRDRLRSHTLGNPRWCHAGKCASNDRRERSSGGDPQRNH